MISVDTEQHIIFLGPHGGPSVTQSSEAVKPAEDMFDSSDVKEPPAVTSVYFDNEGKNMEVDYDNGTWVIFVENESGGEDNEIWPESGQT